MNVLIAPDKFKDSLIGLDVGKACERGIHKVSSDIKTKVIPMADGGEGTVEALIDATGGILKQVIVHDPLMRPVRARYGLLGNGHSAIIEMAAASGIELLAKNERNPMVTTTYGTGELILHALNEGCKRIIVGIGGSATNDCGVGMAQALGIKFSDDKGNEINRGGGFLGAIQKIDTTHADKRIKETEIIVACDVTNTLTGPQGASYVYGPQKGATKDMVTLLDSNLGHVSTIIASQLQKEVSELPGAGAAGGLGAGLIAFAGAKLKPGFEIVSQEVQLEEYIRWANLVITGEGKIDNQTQYGKTPMGVAKLAKKNLKPVVAIAGTLGAGYTDLYKLGFDGIFSILDTPMKLEEALLTAPDLIERCSESITRLWLSKCG